MAFKILIGIVLLGHSCNYINNFKKPATKASGVRKTRTNSESKNFDNSLINDAEEIISTENNIQDLTPRKRIINEDTK